MAKHYSTNNTGVITLQEDRQRNRQNRSAVLYTKQSGNLPPRLA